MGYGNGNMEKVPVATMIAAMIEARGVKAVVAELVGVHWTTVHNYCKRYPSVQAAYEEAIAGINDKARGNLVNAIDNGDLAESKWWLTKKDPEFAERIFNETKGEVVITVKYADQ